MTVSLTGRPLIRRSPSVPLPSNAGCAAGSMHDMSVRCTSIVFSVVVSIASYRVLTNERMQHKAAQGQLLAISLGLPLFSATVESHSTAACRGRSTLFDLHVHIHCRSKCGLLAGKRGG